MRCLRNARHPIAFSAPTGVPNLFCTSRRSREPADDHEAPIFAGEKWNSLLVALFCRDRGWSWPRLDGNFHPLTVVGSRHLYMKIACACIGISLCTVQLFAVEDCASQPYQG